MQIWQRLQSSMGQAADFFKKSFSNEIENKIILNLSRLKPVSELLIRGLVLHKFKPMPGVHKEHADGQAADVQSCTNVDKSSGI
ncbi:MAG: hypothetical protein GY860_12055 [Desulfobacteraceae bacterium]|nr:hypothetical protein [Desulfobacteraceae bacterium]